MVEFGVIFNVCFELKYNDGINTVTYNVIETGALDGKLWQKLIKIIRTMETLKLMRP